MEALGLDVELLLGDLARLSLAFVVALPIGWERGHGRRSVGFRTLPVVAMAACGFVLIAKSFPDITAEGQARVLQGIIGGIGFIGAGAIVKQGIDVRGLATAASIWNAGAIGAAIGFDRLNVALALSAINFISLWLLSSSKEKT